MCLKDANSGIICHFLTATPHLTKTVRLRRIAEIDGGCYTWQTIDINGHRRQELPRGRVNRPAEGARPGGPVRPAPRAAARP